MQQPMSKTLEHKLHRLLNNRRKSSTLRTLTLSTPSQVDFSSNDFLSLSTSPLLKSLYLAEIQKSNLPLGSGGSRLLDGNSLYAEALEREISEFHGAEEGLLFNSGFDANAGFFACVPQKGDVIVYDELVHASVHDGMRLSRAVKTVGFKHNCVKDLRKVLEGLLEETEGLRRGETNVIVAVESIYSMDGDVAPLKEIVSVVEGVLGRDRGYIVVDEAHSTGVLGPKGRGLVCELGLEKHIFARLHTFGKALAGDGAIILGSPTLRHYLINYARPLIYTTFLSYPSLALIRSSYQLLRTGQTVPLQEHLHHLMQTLFASLQQLHNTSSASRCLLNIPNACPQSPIFSIQLQRPRELAKFLQMRGMMIRAVVPPTVPWGTERVRVCLHAGNTVEEVERLIRVLKEWCEEQVQGSDNAHEASWTDRARL
ncbi:PLP-dependent transferase [Dothidotthia symphoricarpi CBS 119687]|uniref:PLP-dependent transferase n=1 Tax=Dothidotthia symphoricarpi CBS 119687 TaxID=1392245 RepID=A0A6A6AEP9_9PLEO|nr:PLP-dependent transferase [Dothidotthia symphoricarpi CBS 119687]KAF2129585.1 PLP-dependent transferase [Dothidotthia symphoricarpi CBS 119687]